MGYYMSQIDSNFRILSQNKNKALEAIKEFASSAKRRWIDSKIISDSKTFEEAMDETGWEVHMDDDGNINDISFVAEKLGDDYELFQAIAPFVEDNSYIQMSGEEDDIWRWIFRDGECQEVYPTIIWP